MPGHTVLAAPFTPPCMLFPLVLPLVGYKQKLRVAKAPIGAPRLRVAQARPGGRGGGAAPAAASHAPVLTFVPRVLSH